MWFKGRLSEKGDTIVEVLIVLSVLSLAFATSSAIANRSLQQARNAEEHSQAMGVLSSQIEMVRKALSTGVTLPNTGAQKFCMTSASSYALTSADECQEGDYELYVPAIEVKNGYYELVVSWEGTGNTGPQKEVYRYKIHDVYGNAPGGTGAALPGGGVGLSPTPPPPPVTTPVQPLAKPLAPTLTLQARSTPSRLSAQGTYSTTNGGTITWYVNSGMSVGYQVRWFGSHGAGGTSTTCSNNYGVADTDLSGSRYFSVKPNYITTYRVTCHSSNASGDSPSVSQTVRVEVRMPRREPLYRYWHGGVGDHFYTASLAEGQGSGFYPEGHIGYINVQSRVAGEVPLYRMFSPSRWDHYYTVSPTDVSSRQQNGYILEGVQGYVPSSCTSVSQPIFKMYSYRFADTFFTNRFDEYGNMRDLIVYTPRYDTQEGVAFCTYRSQQ